MIRTNLVDELVRLLVRMCVCARARACVRACVYVCVGVWEVCFYAKNDGIAHTIIILTCNLSTFFKKILRMFIFHTSSSLKN